MKSLGTVCFWSGKCLKTEDSNTGFDRFFPKQVYLWGSILEKNRLDTLVGALGLVGRGFGSAGRDRLGWAWGLAVWARWLGWAWCWACWARWLGWAWCWAWDLAVLGALAGSTKVYFQSTKVIFSKYKRTLSNYTKVYSGSRKVRFQSTQVYSGSTKVYFQSTQIYFQNTKVYSQSTKVCSRSTNIYFQSTKIYFQITQVYFKVEMYTLEVQKYTVEVQKYTVEKKPKSKVVESAIWFNWFTCAVWGLCWYHFDRFDNEFRGTLTNLQTQVVVPAVPSVPSIKKRCQDLIKHE